MWRRAAEKLHNGTGLVRAALLLIIPISILLILIAWPFWQRFRWQSACVGCNSALATARDFLSIDYVSGNDNPTEDDAKEVVAKVMDGWNDLCPDGGTVYLVRTGSEPPYTLVCGLHDTDEARRTRLNAGYVLSQVDKALNRDASLSQVEVTLNGKTYMARHVDEPAPIYRGTDKTADVKGTVIYYGTAGGGTWTAENAEDGDALCYFLFADENHCACWQKKSGWTGDSYT